jgi:hypothetical protein
MNKQGPSEAERTDIAPRLSTNEDYLRRMKFTTAIVIVFAVVVSIAGLSISWLISTNNRFNAEAQARDHFVAVWNVQAMQLTNGSVRILDKYDPNAWGGYNYDNPRQRITVTVHIGSCTTGGELRRVPVSPKSIDGTNLLLAAPTGSNQTTQMIDLTAPNFHQMIQASKLGSCIAGNASFWALRTAEQRRLYRTQH